MVEASGRSRIEISLPGLSGSLSVKELWVSSALPVGTNQAFDGDPSTADYEGTDGSGIGEEPLISFDTPVSIDMIEFMAGYFDERWFSVNNRIKSFAVKLVVSEIMACTCMT